MDIHTQHIIAYLEGRLSKEDKNAFEQQMQFSPDFKKEVDDIRFIWETTAELKLHKQINTRQNWEKVSRLITIDKYKKKIISFIRTSAAVLLIPVLIATCSLINTLKEWNNLPVEQVELTTAYGLISKVTLPDGSEVWLNSGSSISYPKRFTDNKRNIQLTGEAYFKVSSDKSNRFDVSTSNGLQVSAYGTEFNVKAYEDEDKIEATLAKGHIEVTQTGQPVYKSLQPGEQAVFYKNNNKIEVDRVNLAAETSWKDGKMIFRRANMNEIVKRLARHFNVDIKLEGEELYDYKYSATFTTETLNDVLFLLEKTAPIKCTVIEPEQTDDLTYSRRTVIIKTIK